MAYEVLVLDVDGTLMRSDKTISQKTIDEINYYIDDAIHEGKHMVMIYGFISDETVEILKEYGYTLMESDTHFQIVW